MRKRSGVPSGELSDTRRLGSADARWYASQGEKAVFRRRSIAARNAVKTPGETARGAGARPRCAAPRRTRPEVPSAVTVGAASGAEPSKTSRVAQDCDPKTYMVYVERSQGRANRPFIEGEHRCPDRDRTLEGKPAQKRPRGTTAESHRKTAQKDG